MEDWIENTIDELSLNESNSVVDGPFGSNLKVSDLVENGIPILQGTNITGDRFRFENIRFISKEKAKTLFRSNAKVGDLITVKIGSVGYSAIVNDLHEYPYAIIPANLMRSRFNPTKILTKYVYFFLTSNRGKKSLIDLASNTAQPALSLKGFKNLIISHPKSLPEQTRIAEILSTAYEAIEQTEKLIAKYQRIKTGLMQDLLTRGINEHGNIRSKATHKFVVKNGIEVPEEWEVKSVGEITDHIGSGITPKGGSNVYEFSGVMLIRSQNVLVGKFNFNDVAFITEEINLTMRRSELRDLDVLLNITGASIGRSHYIPVNFPKANVNQHVCSIRIKNVSIGKSFFVSSYLNSPAGQLQIKRLLGASNREGLNYQQIREIAIPLPDIQDDDEFHRIYSVIVPITDYLETEEKKLLKLHSLKTSLMQDLLSGRVRVKVEKY